MWDDSREDWKVLRAVLGRAQSDTDVITRLEDFTRGREKFMPRSMLDGLEREKEELRMLWNYKKVPAKMDVRIIYQNSRKIYRTSNHENKTVYIKNEFPDTISIKIRTTAVYSDANEAEITISRDDFIKIAKVIIEESE